MLQISTPLKASLMAFFISTLGGCESGDSVNTSHEPAAASAPITREAQAELSQHYADKRKAQIARVDYQLSIALDEQSDYFNGTVVIDFDLAAGNNSPVTLDFNGGVVESVQVNGKHTAWNYENWFITLANDLFTSGKNIVEVRYHHKFSTDGSGFHRFKDPETGEIYLYTDFEPYDANRLFPHFDQPNLKARYTLDVLAPSQWQVISTTRETKVSTEKAPAATGGQQADPATAAPRKHWHFPQSAKISSYVFSLHAGPYQLWEDKAGDIPLRLFSRQAIAKYVKTEEWFTPTKQSFAFFNKYFDVPYPFGKYDQVIVPDFNSGAMENVAAVTFSERFVHRGEKSTAERRQLANVIAHEMAHMWFGDLVTMDWWNGLWLNESFATYMANLALDKASDFDEIWEAFYASTKQWAYTTDQLVTTHAIELPVATTGDAFTNFDGITYGKGASVLKQLPYFLGEEAFRQGVSNYLKKYAYQNTSLDDFITELGLAADKNLDQWKQQWLYETGLNTLEVSYTCEANQGEAQNQPENGKVKQLVLTQTAPAEYPTLRQQRVQVGLYRLRDGEMQLDKLVPVTYQGRDTEVDTLAGAPCPDFVYPNVGDWGYVKVNFDPASLKTLKKHINAFADPGLRLMLWQNLWDNVRDIRLPLTDYIDFVVANMDSESYDNLVRATVYNLQSAFAYLAALDNGDVLYSRYKAAIERFMWAQAEQAEQAEAGGDLQKAWFDAFVSVVHAPVGLHRLTPLLQGELKLDGLTIDQDKRWELIVSLNHYQYGEYAQLLSAELEADNSDRGQNMALAAEAIRPQAAVKEKWVNIILDAPQTYKLSTLRHVMRSLFPADQKELLEPFSERLLAAVPALNETAELRFLGMYANSLAPATCSGESVERLAKANGAFSDFRPALVKGFKIRHQEDQRCVRIGELIEERKPEI